METTILNAEDFEKAEWLDLIPVDGNTSSYKTHAKVIYSGLCISFLVECEDNKFTSTLREDNIDLYNEDVIEIFLWPNEDQNLYFEYEISPYGYELPLIVPNYKGKFMGWLPWHYEKERKITKKVLRSENGNWSAEFTIPFELLKGLGNTPPVTGTKWRANIFRMDYDTGRCNKWAWCPDVKGEFHDFNHFGTFIFE